MNVILIWFWYESVCFIMTAWFLSGEIDNKVIWKWFEDKLLINDGVIKSNVVILISLQLL